MRLLSFTEGIIFMTYFIISGGLTGKCLSRKTSLWIWGVILGSVVMIQTALLLSGQDSTLVITLLPVTAYLPLALGVLFLTGLNYFQTAAIWTMGFMASYILKILRKILFLEQGSPVSAIKSDILVIAVMLLTACILILLVFCLLRKTFDKYTKGRQPGWVLLCFPILLSYLLLSYISDSTTNVTLLVLGLLIAFSVFVMVIRILISQASLTEMEESERKMELRMQAQRQEYEDIRKKMEAGRIYRHDMRHHILVLKELALGSETADLLHYLENMSGKLSEVEREVYCANPTVNAVISSYIAQAKKAGCAVTAKIFLPEQIPFDEMDICMVLANAIENAKNACDLVEEEKRYLHIKVEFLEDKKLFVSIKNPCSQPVNLDDNGVPIYLGSDEHGVGMKSMNEITEKYHGFLRCKCEEEEFTFQAVMFGSKSKESIILRHKIKFKKVASAMFFCGFAVLLCLGGVPMAVQALSDLTGEGVLSHLKKVVTWKAGWGDTYIQVEYPILDEVKMIMDSTVPAEELLVLMKGAENMNLQIEAYVEEAKTQFRKYLFRKCEGYVGCNITWQILRDDEKYLSINMIGTVNVGGSGEFSHCYTLDKSSGNILKLKELFPEDIDYVSIISEEILRQMTEQAEKGEARYFIPGYGWSENECFQKIDGDQNFYINDQDQLVIVFDEYEVAPGSMGMPEFVIDIEYEMN